jgi:hypothetical protein
MTVGELRLALAGLPDNAPVYPEWNDRIPKDNEPGVRLHGVRETNGEAQVLVSLFYLDDDTDEEDE